MKGQNKKLQARVILQKDHRTGELLESPVVHGKEVYVYSETPFYLWFKVDNQWTRMTETQQSLGIMAEPPEGSTHYYVEPTEADQIVIGFDDIEDSFSINKPDFW